MNNHDKNKIVGFGTTPKFNNRMVFCVRGDTINVELEDSSRKGLADERSKRQEQILGDLTGINFPEKSYGYAETLIQRQAETIEALQQQISEAEQELFEKDKEIARLENDLEEVCEELFLEVNLR
jgi:hypothetical protein